MLMVGRRASPGARILGALAFAFLGALGSCAFGSLAFTGAFFFATNLGIAPCFCWGGLLCLRDLFGLRRLLGWRLFLHLNLQVDLMGLAVDGVARDRLAPPLALLTRMEPHATGDEDALA